MPPSDHPFHRWFVESEVRALYRWLDYDDTIHRIDDSYWADDDFPRNFPRDFPQLPHHA